MAGSFVAGLHGKTGRPRRAQTSAWRRIRLASAVAGALCVAPEGLSVFPGVAARIAGRRGEGVDAGGKADDLDGEIG